MDNVDEDVLTEDQEYQLRVHKRGLAHELATLVVAFNSLERRKDHLFDSTKAMRDLFGYEFAQAEADRVLENIRRHQKPIEEAMEDILADFAYLETQGEE